MNIVFILEIIGTIAFAFSGAMMGMKKRLDVLGVVILAVVVAVGGGCIRDVLLGIGIPVMFRDPTYVMIAVAVALVLFVWAYIRKGDLEERALVWMDEIMKYADTIGLAVFTVSGIRNAFLVTGNQNMFLAVVVGVITGVGGGVMRDVLVGMKPYIFVKHVYALSAAVGGVVCAILWLNGKETLGMLVGAVLIVVIRLLAIHYQWNLPKVGIKDDTRKE